jgi:putative FmdB family regulatory protein
VPIYEYACPACGERFEELVRSPETRVACPACGAEDVERRLSALAPAPKSSATPDYSRLAHHARSGGGHHGHAH